MSAYKTILILLMSISISSLSGQDGEFGWNNYLHVMAQSGLSQRTEPSLSGEKIQAIPFGEQVRNHGAVGKPGIIEGKKSKWVKVSYQGKTGYVFGAYLKHFAQLKSSLINREVRMEYRCNMQGNINYDPALNWYGMYREGYKGYLIKKVNLEILPPEEIISEVDEEGYFMDFTLDDPSQDKKADFFIGSKKRFQSGRKIQNLAGPVDIDKTWSSFVDTSMNLGDLQLQISHKQIEFEPVNAKENEPHAIPMIEHRFSLSISRNGQSQKLSYRGFRKEEGEFVEELLDYFPTIISIDFAGDIDGDGHTDLIVREGGIYGRFSIYLSSYAKEGKLLKLMTKRQPYYDPGC